MVVRISAKDFKNLYRYMGFVDIGNGNGCFTISYIVVDEEDVEPDIRLIESYWERCYGGIIEKVNMPIADCVYEDLVWIDEDDLIAYSDIVNTTEIDWELDWKWRDLDERKRKENE